MTCQSCTGRCHAPQACHKPDPRDVDLSAVFPLERVMRRYPRAAFVALMTVASSPAWAGGALALIKNWSNS